MVANPNTYNITVVASIYNDNGLNVYNINIPLYPRGSNFVKFNNFVEISSGYVILTSDSSFAGFVLYDGTKYGRNWRAGFNIIKTQ